MANLNQGLPGVPTSPMVDSGGNVNITWYTFFQSLWARTGGAVASASILLDTITSVLGALIVRGPNKWQALAPGNPYQVLRTGVDDAAAWSFLDGNSFGDEAANSFFAGPPGGAAAVPSFRGLVTADLDPTRGQYPGSNDAGGASAGNIGEYLSQQVALAGALPLASASPTDIASLVLTPGDWDLWGSISTAPDGSATQSDVRGWISQTSGTDPNPPNHGAYAELNMAIAAGLTQTLPIGAMRITVPAATQTVYLSTSVTFAAGTLKAYGFLGARRRR